MKNICAVSGQEFEITDEDVQFYEKMEVPVPTLCPEERQRRRLAWRNERNLYRRKCDCCNKSIIAIFPSDAPFPVYCMDCWWLDSWSAKDYGRDFDFSRPFFEQYQELLHDMPQIAMVQSMNENSEYINYAGSNKNCYLMFNVNGDEDCLYGKDVFGCTNCVDNLSLYDSELCFECVQSTQCYSCKFVWHSQNCIDCAFLDHCIGCSNCFGCVNLRNKQYYFLNEKCSKEEYSQKLKALRMNETSGLEKLMKHFQGFLQKFPHRYMVGVQNEDCVGNYLQNCKNAIDCFNSTDLEDCRYVCDFIEGKDCMDVDSFGFDCELIYEGQAIGRGVKDTAFGYVIPRGGSAMRYCQFCHFSHDLFGCSGIRSTNFCILNKEYPKKEYFRLRNKIIEHMKKTGEWGEFFPIEISPFAYNETAAQEQFPLTKKDALSKGYKWKEKESSNYQTSNFKIPDDITKVPDTICNELLACKCCGKNYKIQKAELKFYKKMNLPVSHKCPDCRHADRMNLRNPRNLWGRKCDNCKQEFQTTFAPDRPEKVYCEKCYLDCTE